MELQAQIFEHLAGIFSYPDTRMPDHLREIKALIQDRDDLLGEWNTFADFLQESGIERLEEIFTQAFDLSTTNCLEIGWHLYGEDYKRGQFLVRMRVALSEHGITESQELPDHLSHCLRLLARLDDEDSGIFASHFLQPALSRIVQGLDPQNVYRNPLVLLGSLLAEVAESSDHPTDSSLPVDSSVHLPVLNGV